MPDDRLFLTEQIQRMAAALVATHPAGAGLCLIGGFRYRLLDRGARFSVDIDYHWIGDLATKQQELVNLFQRRLLSDVRRRLNLDGSVAAGRGDSPVATVVDLAFWRLGSNVGRIEIPIDILRLECTDPPTVRTTDGVVYRTTSNADMLESKVIAVVGRTFLEHRDLVDLYLFESQAAPDAAARLSVKLATLGIQPDTVARRLEDLGDPKAVHVAAVDRIIREQVDSEAAEALLRAGGGAIVVPAVHALLDRLLSPPQGTVA